MISFSSEQASFDPTGNKVWLSSRLMPLLLRRRVQRDAFSLPGIIELGAGTGLCGIAAAHLGFPSVILTDREPSILKLLRENAALNAVQGRSVSVKCVSWEHDGSPDPQSSAPELVISCDCLYAPEAPLLLCHSAMAQGRPASDGGHCFLLMNAQNRLLMDSADSCVVDSAKIAGYEHIGTFDPKLLCECEPKILEKAAEMGVRLFAFSCGKRGHKEAKIFESVLLNDG